MTSLLTLDLNHVLTSAWFCLPTRGNELKLLSVQSVFLCLFLYFTMCFMFFLAVIQNCRLIKYGKKKLFFMRNSCLLCLMMMITHRQRVHCRHHLSDLGADAVFKSIFTCVFLQSAGENIMINSVRADGPAVWLTWISSVSVS